MVQPPFEIFLVPTWLRVPMWSGISVSSYLTDPAGNESVISQPETVKGSTLFEWKNIFLVIAELLYKRNS